MTPNQEQAQDKAGPPVARAAAYFDGQRVQIALRKAREAKVKKIFGRQNVGRVAPRG